MPTRFACLFISIHLSQWELWLSLGDLNRDGQSVSQSVASENEQKIASNKLHGWSGSQRLLRRVALHTNTVSYVHWRAKYGFVCSLESQMRLRAPDRFICITSPRSFQIARNSNEPLLGVGKSSKRKAQSNAGPPKEASSKNSSAVGSTDRRTDRQHTAAARPGAY